MKMLDITNRMVNTPLLMSQESAEQFAALAPRSFQIEDHSVEFGAVMFDFAFGSSSQSKPYKMIGDAAVIPIQGTLLHRVNWSGWGITGYNFIRNTFQAALQDPDVKGIIFDVNSGGGEVAGAFDLADMIYQNRGVKPTLSVVDEHAYSAAYLLASAAEKMVVPQTGGAGSIGVVTMHADMSKMLDNYGVKVTFIHAGAHKVDGNPYEPLPADVKNRIQARIDSSYDLFVNAVSRQRGLSADAVRKTEALTYGASDAKSIGLVDAVKSPQEAIGAFVAELNGKKQEKTVMANATDAQDKAVQPAPGEQITQAALDAAKAEAFAAGQAEERQRCLDVMGGEHFKGREALAIKMMANPHLSATEINEMLSETPMVAENAANPFEAAMNGSDNPNIQADGEHEGGDDDGRRMLRNYQSASGLKLLDK